MNESIMRIQLNKRIYMKVIFISFYYSADPLKTF